MKLRKKVKLVQGTIALIVVAFVALGAMGVINLVSSTKLNSYYTSLSSDSVVTIETYGDMNSTFNELRNYLTKVIDRPYSDVQIKDVENADTRINDTFTKIKGTNSNASESLAIKQIHDNYTSYMAVYTDVASKRKSGATITLEQSNEFATIGASITDEIKTVVENEAMKKFGDTLEEFVTLTGVVNNTAGSIGSMASIINCQLE